MSRGSFSSSIASFLQTTINSVRGLRSFISGGTDGTAIGNVSDALKVSISAPSSTILPSINTAHYYLHLGRHFEHSEIVTLSSGQMHDHCLVTAASGTRYLHFTYSFSGSGDTRFYLYEAPTLTLGSATAVYNNNRNSANSPVGTLYDVASITSVGTVLRTDQIGQGQNRIGSTVNTQEFILKANTRYLLRIESQANSNIVNYLFNWYEFDYTAPGT